LQYEGGKIIVPCNWILRELQRKSTVVPKRNYFEFGENDIASNSITSAINH